MLQTLRLCFYIIPKLGDELSHLPFSWKLWALHRGSFLLRKCDFFFFFFFLIYTYFEVLLQAYFMLNFEVGYFRKRNIWAGDVAAEVCWHQGPSENQLIFLQVSDFVCFSKLQDMLWNLIHVVWSKDIFLLSMELFCLMLLSFTGISRANRKVSMQVRCRSCFLVYPGWEMNMSKLILSFLALRNSVFLCRLCKREGNQSRGRTLSWSRWLLILLPACKSFISTSIRLKNEVTH